MGARSYCAAMLIAAGLAGCFSEHTSGPTIGGEGVTVGDILFQSNHNGSSNPAVDTVAVGTSVTWTWVKTGATPHSVESVGSPSFPSSGIMMGSGTVYTFQFTTRGRYDYNCAVHGSAMTGTIAVL